MTAYRLDPIKQKIDYSIPVTGKTLDFATYADKLKQLDYILKNDLIRKDNDLALSLLSDPMYYAYCFLKDDSGNPFKLSCYQDAIASCQYDFDPMNPNRFILFRAANQIGKTGLLIILAITHALHEDNKNIIIVSRSLPQSQFVLAELKKILNNSIFSDTWRADIGDTANSTVLTFQRKGGKVLNRIICAPSGEGLLGYPVHYLFLDEADFYENGRNFFWKVAFPRTNKTKGQIILFSNPNPDIGRQSSLLWELWHGDLFQRKFHFMYLDSPWNTREEYERDKRNSAGYIFTSTHDGEFPANSGGFFKNKEIQDMLQHDWKNQLPHLSGPGYIGIDFAKVRDQTVLVLGEINGDNELHVRYMQQFELGTDYDIIVDRLKQLIDFYSENHGIMRVGFDVTGIGDAINDIIKLKGVKATPVLFSLPNKSKMYANFKMLAEQRRIKIVYDYECERQLSGLVFKRTETGKLSIQHEREDLHDDYPDAICCLIDVSVCPSIVPVSVTRVGDDPIKKDKKESDIDRYMRGVIRANRPKSIGGTMEESMFGGLM